MHRATRRLPGVQPLDPADWLQIDEAYAGQMALRDRLIAERPGEVIAAEPGSGDALAELYAEVLAALAADPRFSWGPGRVRRPDGVLVDLRPDRPLETLGRLVQEDFCLLQKPEGADEHHLTAAVLCFPASWTLAEKIGRPLMAIHTPVAPYDAAMGARVQRLFDGVRPGHPLWRQNALFYADPALYQPRPEAQPRVPPARRPGFLRSERQCILRLPETGAVVFSIHTWVLPVAALSGAQRAALAENDLHEAGRSA